MADPTEGKAGWLWKHVPRDADTDKSSMKRLMVLKLRSFRSNFQKRWVEYQPDLNRLAYYKTEGETMAAGVIFISDVVEVRVAPEDDEQNGNRSSRLSSRFRASSASRGRSGSVPKASLKTPNAFEVVCRDRTFILCCEDNRTMFEWINLLSAAVEALKEFRLLEVETANSKHLRIADMCDVPEDFMTSSLFSQRR